MPNSLFPAFVRLNYHSAAAPHSQTIPTLPWLDVESDGEVGEFETWGASTIDALDMITNLVDELVKFFDALVTYDNFVIFTQEDAEADPVPRASGSFTAKVGTETDAGWGGAVQTTISFRTTLFGLSKLTLLDSASRDDFNPITVPVAPYTTLIPEFAATFNGWSGQDGGRPATFIRATKTLNEKLRRAYHYT